MIELKNISKHFDLGDQKIQLFSMLNLKVEEGEKVAIMGKSGSGKSTILSLLTGLEKPQTGEIKIKGMDIVNMSDDKLSSFRAKNIGMIFQQFNLISTLKAWENIHLPLSLLGRGADKDISLQWLQKVGLELRANHYPHQLSGGECQRVAMARALVHGPSVILADEPSGSLDEETGQKVMQDLFNLVSKSKATLLLVTHDKELAQYCDRVINLEKGSLH